MYIGLKYRGRSLYRCNSTHFLTRLELYRAPCGGKGTSADCWKRVKRTAVTYAQVVQVQGHFILCKEVIADKSRKMEVKHIAAIYGVTG